MTGIEIIKAAVLSLAAMGVIYFISYKATDYKPGYLTKAANEIAEAKNEIADLEKQLRQIDGNAILNDYVWKWQDGVRRLSPVTEPTKTVLMYQGEEISLEKARLLQKDGIGLVADWAKPLRTVKLSDHSHRCKCAYCGCTNDHIYGTCDYCGAPLEG